MGENNKLVPVSEILEPSIFQKHLEERVKSGGGLPPSMYEYMGKGKGHWFVDPKGKEIELPAKSILWSDCVWIYTYENRTQKSTSPAPDITLRVE